MACFILSKPSSISKFVHRQRRYEVLSFYDYHQDASEYISDCSTYGNYRNILDHQNWYLKQHVDDARSGGN